MGKNIVEFEERIQLKKAVHERNQKAICHLHTVYKKYMQQYIQNTSSFDGHIDDLVQETFLAICAGKCKYRQETDVKAYLCGVLKNIILRHLRQKRREVRTCCINDFEKRLADELIDKTSPLEKIIRVDEFTAMIRTMLSRLPTKSQEAVILILFEKLNPKEAAVKAGCSLSTFYRRLQRAREMLKQMNSRP